MADFRTLRYEARDGLAFITLARPQKRNAMSLEMFAELAEAAERMGLADRVVAASSLAEEAEALARAVTAHSPITAAFAKRLIDRANETGLEVELEREGQAQAAVLRTDDHREAIAAFLERRPPTFTGR